MKREFSAGGIVLRQAQDKFLKNKWEVLLTQNSSNKYWGFPKGTPSQWESMKEVAVREVREEGGVEAEIIEKVGDSKYFYTHPENKEKIFKMVTVYLMKYLSGDPKDHDWEVSEADWFSPEEALKILSFSPDKILLKKALECINK